MDGGDGAARVLPRGLLVAGIALRVLAILRFPVSADASEYAVLARSILQGRGMWVPYGEAWDLGSDNATVLMPGFGAAL